jgi:hypothetical protein
MEKEAALEAQQLDFDRKRTALEMKHSEATDWLFRVTCAWLSSPPPPPHTHTVPATLPLALCLLAGHTLFGRVCLANPS